MSDKNHHPPNYKPPDRMPDVGREEGKAGSKNTVDIMLGLGKKPA